MSDLPRTLFTGRRSTAVTWYRCVLPAEFLGQDWIAVEDGDGELVRKTGTPGVEFDPAAWAGRYDVVVLNQPRGRLDDKNAAWLKASAQRHKVKEAGRDHSRFFPALTA